MDDATPMFTMVKSQTLGESPAPLSEKSQGLLETLSMLCSFHTAEDLASFLYSPMFVELAQQGEVWLGFEIGLYVDHAKIFDLIPSEKEVLFADNASTGVFEGNLHRCVDEQDAAVRLKQWYSVVHSPQSRFE
jgi:hypothetical protein